MTQADAWRMVRCRARDGGVETAIGYFDPMILQQLPDSAVLVAVLTDNYVESKWCQRETHAFCEAATQKVGLAPDDKSRVFKIIKPPPKRQDTLPALMLKILGTPFYVRVDKDERESKDENDKPLPLNPIYGADYEKKLNMRVALLALDIKKTLEAIDAAGATGAPLATAAGSVKRPTVYLAQCGNDRCDDRETLRGELLQRRYRVLPDRELPFEEAAYRAEVARLLERSALSVHLLGASPGSVPDGEAEDSVVVIQNALAVAQRGDDPARAD